MVFGVFRKRVSPAHQAAGSGAQGAEPTLDVVGFACLLAAATMRVWWKRGRVSLPVIAAGGAPAVARRQRRPQIARALQTAVTERPTHDLAGPPAQRHPEPKLTGFATHEAPEFIEFKHVTVFSGQERVHESRQTLRFFPPPTGSRFGSRHRRCG